MSFKLWARHADKATSLVYCLKNTLKPLLLAHTLHNQLSSTPDPYTLQRIEDGDGVGSKIVVEGI